MSAGIDEQDKDSALASAWVRWMNRPGPLLLSQSERPQTHRDDRPFSILVERHNVVWWATETN